MNNYVRANKVREVNVHPFKCHVLSHIFKVPFKCHVLSHIFKVPCISTKHPYVYTLKLPDVRFVLKLPRIGLSLHSIVMRDVVGSELACFTLGANECVPEGRVRGSFRNIGCCYGNLVLC